MELNLCGTLAVIVDGADVTSALPGRQGRRVLAFLVANRGRDVRRDELSAVVWPTGLPAAPDVALRSLLTGVRRVVGREQLFGGAKLSFRPAAGTWIDVAAAGEAAASAESALAAGDVATALERATQAVGLTDRPALVEIDDEWAGQLRAEVLALHCDQLEM